jgi:RHS repeat-associated protein
MRRLSRTEGSTTTTYVWDGAHVIAEYVNGSLAKKYIYGPGMDTPVAMIRVSGSTQTWYYYYPDALGSIRLLSNASGTIVEGYTYDGYGRPRVMRAAGDDGNWLTEDVTTYDVSNPTIGNTILFTGRPWDSTTGLYYCRMRDYSPHLGRFLQPDPSGYIDGMNLYAYVGNNPLNWLDPWGLLRGETHEYLTRRAMQKAGFSEKDIKRVVKANKSVDRLTNQFNNAAHYMPGSHEEAEKIIQKKLQKAKELMAEGKRKKALKEVGKGLHTLQDKYPHKDDGSWWNHAKGLLPLVSSPDDNWGNAYKETKEYLDEFLNAFEKGS